MAAISLWVRKRGKTDICAGSREKQRTLASLRQLPHGPHEPRGNRLLSRQEVIGGAREQWRQRQRRLRHWRIGVNVVNQQQRGPVSRGSLRRHPAGLRRLPQLRGNPAKRSICVVYLQHAESRGYRRRRRQTALSLPAHQQKSAGIPTRRNAPVVVGIVFFPRGLPLRQPGGEAGNRGRSVFVPPPHLQSRG